MYRGVTIYLLLHFLFITVIIIKLLFISLVCFFLQYTTNLLSCLCCQISTFLYLFCFLLPLHFFSTRLPLHYFIIPTSLSPIISFFRNLSSSRLPMHQFIISTVLLRIPSVSSFLSILVLLFLKFLLFVLGKTKEKESYQPFFYCKCSVQSQRCYFHH